MAHTNENQNKKKGKVYSINCSSEKGTVKTAVKKSKLLEDFGLKDDAHAGPGLRQVSLLAIESIRRQAACPKVKAKGVALAAGDFAENITTQDVDLAQLKIGDRLVIDGNVILEISKIGKECHKFCAIYKKIGQCIMPKEGIFAKVLSDGEIAVGDSIEVIKDV